VLTEKQRLRFSSPDFIFYHSSTALVGLAFTNWGFF
jgi:hypothetical protein